MDEDKNDYNPEEEVISGNWNTPKVELKEVEIKTGEEDESLFWSGRSKLYRWVDGEWKERGLGESKLLLHKKKGIIRFLLRQEKTLKVVANHYIYPNESYCKLVPNAGSEKIYAWTVKDFAEEPKIEQFALKFNTAEAAKLFKEKFDEAGRINIKLLDNKGEKEEKKDKDEKEEKKDKNEKEEKKDKDEKEKTSKKNEDNKEKEKTDTNKVDNNEDKNKIEKDNKSKKEELEKGKEEKKEKGTEKDNANVENKEKEKKVVDKEKNDETSKIKNEEKKEEKNKEGLETKKKDNTEENIKRESC